MVCLTMFTMEATSYSDLDPCSAKLLSATGDLIGPGIEAYMDPEPGELCGQIVMMGDARAGKSWFLNYLTDSPGCFVVGNSSKPVTKGADIMYTMLEHSNLFGTSEEEDGEEAEESDKTPIWVPIVDMQGTGDDSSDVDAKLALPLLLTSHAVLFYTNTHPGKHKVSACLLHITCHCTYSTWIMGPIEACIGQECIITAPIALVVV